ncbi:NADH-quinone oxidoreductase subunit N [Daejeonella lutea]|uniref:NADH-quinone oxidoreductase subunit N n=1 Tax=Daejeonella lutea TaxID=572036 RepID=A0A1T5A197_9SPHI|nr:NADH-quinone oxidoreductase subunit N [Daejeonella lutea]SKB28706.1 NADH-quinone oxidoreductase subunit N [Daejeonella lutea]
MMKDFIPYISISLNETINSLSFFYPEFALGLGFLLVILSDLFFAKKFPQLPAFVALLSTLFAGVLSFNMLKQSPVQLFGGMIVQDHLSTLFKLIFCFISILFVLFVRYHKDLQSSNKGTGDLFSILMAVQLGLNLMVMSENLLMVYLSLEMVSVGSYLMVGYLSNSPKQSEAAMKYALFGAVCSAFMLYGMSLIYSFSGSLDLFSAQFVSFLSTTPFFSWGPALIMMLIGVAFKLSLVPFHFWAPDVYQGAPTPVTAFLSTAPKIAGFGILIRLLAPFQPLSLSGIDNSMFSLTGVLAVTAIASMIVGNFGAIWQNNVKRMLAYSSIGHTGFMLMGLFIFSVSGFKAIVFYMVIYSIMNMAAFMIVDEVEEKTGKQDIDEYKGLGKSFSLLMIAMVVVLVSLTGLPPTAGFTAKFLIFSAAIEAYNSSGSGLIMTLIIVGALSTVVSLFYYFRIPLNAFLRKSDDPIIAFKNSPKSYISMFLVFLLLFFIIFPSAILGHL